MLDSIRQWYGAFHETTDKMAEGVQYYSAKYTSSPIAKETAKSAIPLVAGLAVTAGAATQFGILEKGVKATFVGLGNIITGFGAFEKLPLIGGGFTLAGDTVKEAGEYVSYAVPPVLGVLTFGLLSGRGTPAPDGAQTPLHHTSVLADPPKTLPLEVHDRKTDALLAQADVPSAPADTAPLSTSAVATLAPTELAGSPTAAKIAEARTRRRSAQTTQNTAMDAAIQEYILHINKSYVDTRAWIEKAEEYRAGPRKKLVEALQSQGLKAEAEAWVPQPPALPKTIYADGTDFPPELLDFVKKFTDCYGPTGPQGDSARLKDGTPIFTFIDHAGDTPHPKTFDECNVTQKEEFITKAINYFELRKKFFEQDHVEKNGVYFLIPIPWLQIGETVATDYVDHDKPQPAWYSWESPVTGNNNGLPWVEEHRKLREMGAASMLRLNIAGQQVQSSTDISAAEQYHALLDAHIKQRKDSDHHKLELEKANETTLKAWEKTTKEFQQRLNTLRTGHIAILNSGVYSDTKEAFMIIKDLDAGNDAPTQTLAFKSAGDGSFVLSGWRLQDKPWLLPQKDTLKLNDLNDGKQLRAVLDAIQSGKLLAAAASIKATAGSPQSQNTTPAPAPVPAPQQSSQPRIH